MEADNTDEELDALLRKYKHDFPQAEHPMSNVMCFGPDMVRDILIEANGREIVWSYPDPALGICDGCEYRFKEAVMPK